MKKRFFFAAIVGWALGLLVHLLAIFEINAAEISPYAWLLHAGIFIVWVPAILIQRKEKALQPLQDAAITKGFSPVAKFKVHFKNTPRWLIIIAFAGLYYAFFNFFLFMYNQGYTPDIKNGQYILHSHGQLIQTITRQEYNHYKANALRGFSGHWIAFYGMAMAMLYPFGGQEDNTASTTVQ